MSIVPYDRNKYSKAIASSVASALGGMFVAGPQVKKHAKQVATAGAIAATAKQIKNAVAQQFPKNGPSLRGARSGSTASVSTAPVSVGVTTTKLSPSISKSKGSTRIKNTEMIASTILGSTTFTIQSNMHVNPGLSSFAPWLAKNAPQYEQYRIHSLTFEYIPIAPTSTQGDIIMMFDYNVLDTPPSSEVEAFNHDGSKIFPCWQSCKFVCKPSSMFPMGPRKYIRTTAVAGDQKTYDVGAFYLASNNQTGASSVGKLVVHYDVEFFVPQQIPSSPYPQIASMLHQSAVQTLVNGNVSTLVNWTLAQSFPDNLNLMTGYVSGVFTLPAGVYRVTVTVNLKNTVNESTYLELQYWKNGAAVMSSNNWSFVTTPGSSSVGLTVPLDYIMSFNGTDTLQIKAVATGATGVLTTTGDCSLIFQLV